MDKQTKQKTKQWDLTADEAAELNQRVLRKRGALKLLAELQQLKGLETEQDAAWWEKIILTHHIPREYQTKLIADDILHKVWVRGEVDEFDNLITIKGISDNPAF